MRIILVFLLINISFPQEKFTSGEDSGTYLQDTLIALKYFQKGNSLSRAAKYDSAIFCFEKARDIYERINKQTGLQLIFQKILQCNNKIGWDLMRQSKNDSALMLLTKTLEDGISNFGENNIEVAQTYHVIGVVHWAKSDFMKSLSYHRKALSIRIPLLGEKNEQVASSYNNIGIDYEEMGDYDKALEYYDKTLTIDLSLKDLDETDIAKTYNNIGKLYNNKGDYEKGLEYHQKALSIRIRVLGENNPYTANSIINIGVIYANEGNYLKALEYFKKSLLIDQKIFGEMHPSVGQVYNNIGNVYYYLKKYNKALEYCNKSIVIRTKTLGEWNSDLINNYLNAGKIYKEKGNFNLSIESFKKAISIGNRSPGVKSPSVGICLLRLAEVYDLIKDYDSALKFSQKSLISLVIPFNNDSVFVNPQLDGVNSEVELLNTLAFKAGIFKKLSGKTNLPNLQMSLSTYKLASDLIDKMRTGYKTQGSKLFLGEQSSKVFDKAIQISLELFNSTKEEKYKEDAFLFAEKSKAAVLQEGLAEVKAKQFGKLPAKLLEVEKQLKIDLTFYETQLQNEYLKKDKQDTAKEFEYEDTLFGLRTKYEVLIAGFEKDYPAYHNLKYQTKTISVTEIQEQIPVNTTLIEYFTGEKFINVFTVSKDKFKVISIRKPTYFQELVKDFYSSILKTETEKYIASGNKLSKLLISSVLPEIKGNEKLVIIPHEVLYKIPFEALFTKQHNPYDLNYSQFNYLVKSFDISYHYSAALYINSLKDNHDNLAAAKSQEKNFIAFAPVFPEKDISGYTLAVKDILPQSHDQDHLLRSVTKDGKKLNELKYSEWEVKHIIELFPEETEVKPSVAYFYSDATEEKFKSDIKNYNIVHIATHSFINEAYPQISGIVFAQPRDPVSGDDGILYAGEVYNLDLNADLVVLSSCESGLGKLIKGEGMMALTRGFLYSGVNDIIFSLWKVPDKHTSELMIEFYKSALNKYPEKSYSRALREAKLTLIKNPSTARPRSWASFLLIGSD